MTKTSALSRFKETARDLKDQAGRVHYHIVSRRVTHTVSSVKRLIAIIAEIQKGIQTDSEFFKRAEFGLFQSQVGPTEIRREKNGHMFIQGTFDIEMLQEFFVVNEPEGMVTISVEGGNEKIKNEFDAWSTKE